MISKFADRLLLSPLLILAIPFVVCLCRLREPIFDGLQRPCNEAPGADFYPEWRTTSGLSGVIDNSDVLWLIHAEAMVKSWGNVSSAITFLSQNRWQWWQIRGKYAFRNENVMYSILALSKIAHWKNRIVMINLGHSLWGQNSMFLFVFFLRIWPTLLHCQRAANA